MHETNFFMGCNLNVNYLWLSFNRRVEDSPFLRDHSISLTGSCVPYLWLVCSCSVVLSIFIKTFFFGIKRGLSLPSFTQPSKSHQIRPQSKDETKIYRVRDIYRIFLKGCANRATFYPDTPLIAGSQHLFTLFSRLFWTHYLHPLYTLFLN